MKNKLYSAIIGLLTASGATILHNQTHVAVLEKDVEFITKEVKYLFDKIKEVEEKILKLQERTRKLD